MKDKLKGLDPDQLKSFYEKIGEDVFRHFYELEFDNYFSSDFDRFVQELFERIEIESNRS